MKKYIILSALLGVLPLLAELEIVPGYVSASLHLPGVDVKKEEDFSSKLSFREKDGKFKPALSLICNAAEKTARGVIVNLKENTVYEVKLDCSFNGKKKSFTKQFRTKNSIVPVAETIVLSENNWKKIVDKLKSGTEKGYIRYTAKPGTVLDAKGRKYGIFVKGKYMIFDNLTIKNAAWDGIRLEGANNIIIRNCDISHFGRVGVFRKGKLGRFYEGKTLLNQDSGIWILNSSHILVEKCFVHDCNGHANAWFYVHPAGPKAMSAKHASAVTVRFNDFIGGDTHRYNDVIECFENSSPTGGFYRDAEIYGNYLAISNDDGIELEGGEMNTRFFRNRIEQTLCGVSTGCCVSGPSFVFENLVCNPGDEFGGHSTGFKNGHSKFGTGTLRHFNNSCVGYGHGINAFSVNAHRNYLKFYGLNNLLVVRDSYCSPNGMFYKARSIMDYSLIYGGKSEQYRNIALNKGQEKNGIIAAPQFVDAEHGNYRLKERSVGTKSGKPIPNFTAEKNVDRGAFQSADDLPYRPFSLERDKAVIKLDCEKKTAETVTLTAKEKTAFKIYKNDEFSFFTVTPSEGTVLPGKKLVLTVRVNKKAIKQARINNGAFLIRRADGLSRPVSVSVNSRSMVHLTEKLRKQAVYGKLVDKKENIYEFDVPVKGVWYLMTFGDFLPKSMAVELNGKKYPVRGAGFGISGVPGWRHLNPTGKKVFTFAKGKNLIKITKFKTDAFALIPYAEVFALDPARR